MSFRSIVHDIRDGFGSLSKRGFEVILSGYSRRKSQGSVHEMDSEDLVIQHDCWARLPLELLREIIKKLEASESTWPQRRSVLVCSFVCRSWREMCKEIVKNPEHSGKLTFPISLKQPGPREGHIQCFIKRDESTSTYLLYLCLSPALLVENGKFLLSAKRNRHATYTEYIISMQSNKISKSNHAYIGKLRSNFLGTKFSIYSAQPPYNGTVSSPGHTSRRFHSRKVSPKFSPGNFKIAQVTYELNVLGNRGPRRMNCTMYSIPASSLEAGGFVPGQPERLFQRPLEDSFRSTSFTDFSLEHSMDFSSSRFSDVIREVPKDDDKVESKDAPLVLQNKSPRWHEQLQCWCLNFRGRVTVASVKNFQLIAAPPPADSGAPASVQPAPTEHDKIILQFGKVGKDIFTMDYRYPLSAFQAFAICLSSFDTKLACE